MTNFLVFIFGFLVLLAVAFGLMEVLGLIMEVLGLIMDGVIGLVDGACRLLKKGWCAYARSTGDEETKEDPEEDDEEDTIFYFTDVVVLRTGGPQMAVLNVKGTDVECAWFIGSTLCKAWFDEGALLLAEDGELYDLVNDEIDDAIAAESEVEHPARPKHEVVKN